MSFWETVWAVVMGAMLYELAKNIGLLFWILVLT